MGERVGARRADEVARVSVARVSVAAEEGLLVPVVGFVREVAEQSGLDAEGAARLAAILEVVCRNVCERAFGPDDDGRFEVSLGIEAGRVVAAVEDRGLPFDYATLGAADALPGTSRPDEVRFVNLGRGGNRVEVFEELPQHDVRDHIDEAEHHRTVAAPPAEEDHPLQIRRMRPEEAPELSRAVYRSYGYSYDWDDIYYPDRIEALQHSGVMRSSVAVSEAGEIVGHLAITVPRAGAHVGEAGQAVVDPRFRGHRLFERLKAFAAAGAGEEGLYGLYSEATAAHPYSQRGNLRVGARETGFLLGYIPASVAYTSIGDGREGRRGSVALFYMPTGSRVRREIHPPERYREAVGRITEHNELDRIPGPSTTAPATEPRLDIVVRADHNLAMVRVEEPGPRLADALAPRLRELRRHGIECVYIDLPLGHPGTREVDLAPLGFFFGGVVPELAPVGDVLRLQLLNDVEIRAEDVHTASEFGEELLRLVLEDRGDA